MRAVAMVVSLSRVEQVLVKSIYSISSCHPFSLHVYSPSGTFQNIPGQSSCQLCIPSTYSSSSGAITCPPCPMGTYCNASGLSAAVPCPSGQFSAAGSLECGVCPAGSYCNSTTSVQCVAGTFNPNTRMSTATSCLPCIVGAYCVVGASLPTNCSAGYYTNVTGRTASIDCLACPAGRFGSVQRMSVPSCTDVCPAGSFCTAGASSPSMCPVGSYCTLGASSPIPCSPGKYCPANGLAAGLDCPAGTFMPISSATICFFCGPGTYCNTSGLSVNASCPFGSFSNAINQTTCQLCVAGMTTILQLFCMSLLYFNQQFCLESAATRCLCPVVGPFDLFCLPSGHIWRRCRIDFSQLFGSVSDWFQLLGWLYLVDSTNLFDLSIVRCLVCDLWKHARPM
jgi:hypothetical protein